MNQKVINLLKQYQEQGYVFISHLLDYVIVLEKTPNGSYNEDRDNIVDPYYATYYCDRLNVIDIVDRYDYDNRLTFYESVDVIYTVGEAISGSISYYLSYEKAMQDIPYALKNGIVRTWYDNGQLEGETAYSNSKLNGQLRTWHNNGVLGYEGFYIDDERDGIYKWWNKEGILIEEGTNNHGNICGYWRTWYDNGTLHIETKHCDDGKICGPYKSWNENGILVSCITYDDNGIEKLREKWFDNEQLWKRVNKKDRLYNGLYERYTFDGELVEKYIYIMNQIEEVIYENKEILAKEVEDAKKFEDMDFNIFSDEDIEEDALDRLAL
jgi:antitoxin component YwqK of YwqJK toxin-antitoxin module